jgi:chromosome partitioning protein
MPDTPDTIGVGALFAEPPSITPDGPHHGPQVVVVGNHKGGTGKSTVAMHLAVALLKAGKTVATFDLDLEQQTLTRYIQNRHDWARREQGAIELPLHVPIVEPEWSGIEDGDAGTLERFIASMSQLQNHDFIVIDTPGGPHHLSLVAHAMADTLVTPLNDSFVDLDLMVMIGVADGRAPRPSRYAKAVAVALEERRSVCGRSTDWVVIRNRLPTSRANQRPEVAAALEIIAPQVGFRVVAGLSERAIYRKLFPFGLTVLDQLDQSRFAVETQASDVVARMELRDLVEALGLIAPSERVEDGIETSVLARLTEAASPDQDRADLAAAAASR